MCSTDKLETNENNDWNLLKPSRLQPQKNFIRAFCQMKDKVTITYKEPDQ